MKIKGGKKHQLATAMDPWSKVELLTHLPGGSPGDVQASEMVFFLRQGAGTGTAISSRDRNCEGGGVEVGIEKRILSQGFPRRGIKIGQRGTRAWPQGTRRPGSMGPTLAAPGGCPAP